MKRVVLITNQYYQSKNKAGFHFLADAFWNAGWDVLFFTESISWISWLRRDARFAYPIRRQANRLTPLKDRLASYVWLTPFHPINLRNTWLNRLAGPLLKTYPNFSFHDAAPMVGTADLFVFDSDHGLFLFDRFKQLNPRARCVYRVSDDLPVMRIIPWCWKRKSTGAGVRPGKCAIRIYPKAPGAARARAQLHKHARQQELFDKHVKVRMPDLGPTLCSSDAVGSTVIFCGVLCGYFRIGRFTFLAVGLPD